MSSNTNIAFKEWAVVVDALGKGEQVVILRKGGIHEQRGEFRVAHRRFWLYPTRYHEAETSVIPSKRPALHALAGPAPAAAAPVQFFADVTDVVRLTALEQVHRLQGLHIWSEAVLDQRFAFGREPGLHALVVRVSAAPAPVAVPLRPEDGGCKSWIELAMPPAATALVPVLSSQEFEEQRRLIMERVSDHALAHL